MSRSDASDPPTPAPWGRWDPPCGAHLLINSPPSKDTWLPHLLCRGWRQKAKARSAPRKTRRGPSSSVQSQMTKMPSLFSHSNSMSTASRSIPAHRPDGDLVIWGLKQGQSRDGCFLRQPSKVTRWANKPPRVSTQTAQTTCVRANVSKSEPGLLTMLVCQQAQEGNGNLLLPLHLWFCYCMSNRAWRRLHTLLSHDWVVFYLFIYFFFSF